MNTQNFLESKKVMLLFGGRSNEHAISCVTATSVFKALAAAECQVFPVGIRPDGNWVFCDFDLDFAVGANGELPEIPATASQVWLDQRTLKTAEGKEIAEIDVVFPLLHGPWGEDGTIQGMLEIADIRYVGSGVLASAVGMDKHFMKNALSSAGLPVLPHVLVTKKLWEQQQAVAIREVEYLGYPVFIKPCRGGSSIGISKANNRAELITAVEAAQNHDPRVIVEKFAGLEAREIECGVLATSNGDPQASQLAEIVVTGHEFYDFEAKYLPNQNTQLQVPVVMPTAQQESLQEMAKSAFEALACEGLARVDFFLYPNGTAVINELNTMPGFTPGSMYPKMWEASGISYPELVTILLNQALSRGTGLR